MGVQQALYGIAGACGPILVGALLALTDSWVPAVLLTTVGFTLAALILMRSGKDEDDAGTAIGRSRPAFLAGRAR